MTSLFFGLLPTDLQIDILYVWLNAADCGSSLLKVLSALDVACPPSEQPSLRHLMGQLPPFGECTSTSNHATQYASNCLRWLACRNVPVRALLLADDKISGLGPKATFPHIETLHWKADNVSTKHLITVMLCLPNLTSLHLSVCGVLLDTLTPNLRALTLDRAAARCTFPFLDACSQLEKLRIKKFELNVPLAQQLVKCCQHLHLLEASLGCTDLQGLCLVLQTCDCLKELALHGVCAEVPIAAVVELVAAFPTIRRLTLLGSWNIERFNAAVSLCPTLDYFRTNGFVYSRKDARVESYLADNEVLPTILNSCSQLESFSWHSMLDDNMAALVADKLGDTLKSLTVRATSVVLRPLLERCGDSLRNLCLDCKYHGTCPLALIASTCPHLGSLALHSYANLETGGFSTLFAACPKLKQLTLEVLPTCVNRRAALRAIIQHKLVLETLILAGGFNESDVEWFRQQVRDHQLLPVPEIIVRQAA